MITRGFTVIEMLVGITLLATILGLSTHAILMTRNTVTESELDVDQVVSVAAFLRETSRWAEGMVPADSMVATSTTLSFECMEGDNRIPVTIGSEENGMVVVRVRSDIRARFKGNVAFRYLVDSIWADMGQSGVVPDALSVTLIPEAASGDTPWQMIINLPAGIFNPDLRTESQELQAAPEPPVTMVLSH